MLSVTEGGKSNRSRISFQPNKLLSQYIVLPQPDAADQVDVHDNQVILLERFRVVGHQIEPLPDSGEH